jgi:hypothetical protein
MPMERKQPVFGRVVADATTTQRKASGGYGIWIFSQGAWSLRSAACPVGYAPGAPPAQAGRFEGELIRKYFEPVALEVSIMAADAD